MIRLAVRQWKDSWVVQYILAGSKRVYTLLNGTGEPDTFKDRDSAVGAAQNLARLHYGKSAPNEEAQISGTGSNPPPTTQNA